MTIAPGWYADPNNTAELRWWDGGQWTAQSMSHPAGAPSGQMSPYPPAPAFAPVYAGPPTQKSFLARNINSALAVAVAILYGVIAIFAHFVFLGIFPVILTVNAFRAKEPYAVVALVLTVAAVGLSLFMLTR